MNSSNTKQWNYKPDSVPYGRAEKWRPTLRDPFSTPKTLECENIEPTTAGTRITTRMSTARGQLKDGGGQGRSRKRNSRREEVAWHSKRSFACFRFPRSNVKLGSAPVKRDSWSGAIKRNLHACASLSTQLGKYRGQWDENRHSSASSLQAPDDGLDDEGAELRPGRSER
jgi:hypothetical protein